MKHFPIPILETPPEIIGVCKSICTQPDALTRLERQAQIDDLENLPLLRSEDWFAFSVMARKLFAERDFLVIKGWPMNSDGAPLLLAACTIGSGFRTYRKGQIVKYFKMTPWTKELSHTTREGEFHTDLNTDVHPPGLTVMQCHEPDPGKPHYGVNRVARLADMLAFLKEKKEQETFHFLTNEKVAMLNDRSNSSWTGNIIDGNIIRFHPETLRATARRLGSRAEELEKKIAMVSKAAFAVSEPFILDRGDLLILSNFRTLHYRGACSVVFERFPDIFVSRSIFILHVKRELGLP